MIGSLLQYMFTTESAFDEVKFGEDFYKLSMSPFLGFPVHDDVFEFFKDMGRIFKVNQPMFNLCPSLLRNSYILKKFNLQTQIYASSIFNQ